MKPFLHVQQVKMGYMVMTQILMIHTYQLNFPQTQAAEETLKSLEVQTILLSVAPEQLLDVETLLFL